MDDFLVAPSVPGVVETEYQCRRARGSLGNVLNLLFIVRHPEKSSPRLNHLGVHLDSELMRVYV